MFSRKSLDLWIVIPAVLLSAIGVMVIASVSPDNLGNHLVNIAVGVLFFTIIFLFDRAVLYSLVNYLYGFGLIGLVLPLIFGTITRGSVRWIDLGFITIQPSEIFKLIIVIFSATFWARITRFTWHKLLVYLACTLPPIILILIQPDLGSALVVGICIATAILYSGISPKQIAVALFLAVMILPIGWFGLHDYQHQRILNFVNPYRDPLGSGYNAIQAKITVGSGYVVGRGIGRGTQSHLAFLPERYTDFIFASFAEETGFGGSLVMLTAYILLLGRIFYLVQAACHPQDKILLVSILVMLFFQTLVNVGMNIGIMPITGITLPLVSYGGSSYIVILACLGLVSNIASSLKNVSYLRIG